MHLVRLLRMGVEVLTEGKVLVRRPDAEFLLAVRDGALRYEELLQLAEDMTTDLDARRADSPLPDAPDVRAAEELVVELHREYLTRS